MFGALIRKIFIVMKVLESAQNISTKVQSQRSNQIYSVLTVLLVMLMDAVIIIPWNILSPSAPSAKSFKVPDIGENNTLLTNFRRIFYTSYPQLLLSSIFQFLCISWLIHFHFVTSYPFFHCSAGDIVIDQYQCNSRLTESFTLILVGYKAALTGVGAIIAFRVRSLGKRKKNETTGKKLRKE